ncbi:MAG: EAL domain-containing protein [Candidatus Sedimenticola sp. (ex Thyasira tokunagai)]
MSICFWNLPVIDRYVPWNPFRGLRFEVDMERHIRAEQTRLLYGKIWTALIFTLINGAVLGYVLGEVVEHSQIVIWLLLLTLVTLLRALLVLAFRRMNPPDESIDGWRRAFLLGVVLAGLTWGSTGLLLYPMESITHQVFLAFVLGGMAAGAVTTLSYDWPAIGLFLLLSLSPLVIRLFLESQPLGMAMGTMFLLYLAGILSSARQTYHNTIEAITLRLEAVNREASIRRFKSTLDNTLDSVFMFAPDTHDFLYVNRGAVAMVGFDRGELMSMSLLDIAPEWSREDFRELTDRLLGEPDSSLMLETRYRDKGGRWIPVEMFLQYVNPNGDQGHFIAIVHDITERKSAEETLRRHSEQQAALSALSQYALSGGDLDGLFDQVVVQLARTLGVEYAKVLELSADGQTLLLCAGIGWKSGLVGREVLSTGAESQAGYTLLSEQPVVVEDLRTETRFSAPRLLKDHQVVAGISVAIGLSESCFGVLGCHTRQHRAFTVDDVNFVQVAANLLAEAIERKRAEEQMRLAVSVIEHTPEGVMVTDQDQKILWVNPAFIKTTGYSADEVTDQTPNLLHSGVHGPEFFEAMSRMLHDKGSWQGEIWNRRKSGEVYPEWLLVNVIRDKTGRITHYAWLFTDVSHQEDVRERLKHLAHYDALTDLPNRELFKDRLETALTIARREDHQVALMFLDLDQFKNINDILGHTCGDQLLEFVADQLCGCVRESDTVARLGGDEFTIILPNILHPDDAARVAEKILDTFNTTPFLYQANELAVSFSIGVSIYPKDGEDAETMTQNADIAMYRAKESGRNAYRFYSAEMSLRFSERMRLEGDLRRAVEHNELYLLYQPQVDLRSGKVFGCEVLMRWKHSTQGEISPELFIGVAEETGLIDSLGQWLFSTLSQEVKSWAARGLRGFQLAVNISGVQLRPQYLSPLLECLEDDSLTGNCSLELELTESVLMDNADSITELLLKLKSNGVTVAIDDFGTGYSSLSYLKTFPIDKLKIDRSFVHDVCRDSNDAEIAATIIAMGKNLGLRVIAEGVEDLDQLAFLQKQGCDEAQGFLFGKPVSAAEIERVLNSEHLLIDGQ